MSDIGAVELAGVIIGCMLWSTPIIIAFLLWKEWKGAESWAEKDLGRRAVASIVYRIVGKFLIFVDMLILYLARPGVLEGLRRWLPRHVIVLFLILDAAMTIFFINDVIDWRWRASFSRRVRGRIVWEDISPERIEELGRLDRILREEENSEIGDT